jgi:hypothetical protein
VAASGLHCTPTPATARGSLIPKNQNLQVLFDLSELADEIRVRLWFKFTSAESSLIRNETLATCDTSNADEKHSPLACRVYRLKKKSCRTSKEIETESLIKKCLTIGGQVLSITSILFLLGVYFSSKLLRNLPGKILICLSMALMLSQVFFLLSVYTAQPLDRCPNEETLLQNTFRNSQELFNRINSHLGCFIYGLLSHYFHLAMFAWSFIMAYDMHGVFTALTSKNEKKLRVNENNSGVFRKYLICGCTAPLFMILLLFLTQFVNFKMAYGFGVCFISEQLDLLVFFVLPVIFVLAANAYFLVRSIKSIRSVDRMSKKYLQKDPDSATTSLATQKSIEPILIVLID